MRTPPRGRLLTTRTGLGQAKFLDNFNSGQRSATAKASRINNVIGLRRILTRLLGAQRGA